MLIVKRDGRLEEYNPRKLLESVTKAAVEVDQTISTDVWNSVLDKINEIIEGKDKISVEKLQDATEKALYVAGIRKIRDAYKDFRKRRTEIRETKSEIMNAIHKIGVETDRDNANVGNNFSSKLLRIASESNKWHNLAMMPKDMAKRHEEGDLYYHDLDSYNLTINCLHIPTREVLERGFNTGYGTILPPKRIESAAELSCILLQSTQNDMFGGQAHPNFDNDMAVFVEPTRQEIYRSLSFDLYMEPDEVVRAKTEARLNKTVHQAMQSITYNLNTMHARAGSQVPFSSINLGIPEGTKELQEDAALICKAFLEEYDKGLGKGEQPIFPNIIFRVKKGVNRDPEDPYYYLFQLACKVASKRMNPTFMNIDADFNKEWYDKGMIPATMGCRTYLMSNVNGEPGTKGRGNNAPVTLNLPRLGIKTMIHFKDTEATQEEKEEYFYYLLNEMLYDARKAILHRYDEIKKLKVKDLPFVIGQHLMMGSEGLGDDDSIEPVIKNGTWGIGFIGLAETLTALCGNHHGEDEYARDLGEKIIKHMRAFTDKYKEEDKLNWSCYATPAEGLSGRFILQDKKFFGEIKGVTDKDYYTNSYHVPVSCITSIKDKISIEAPYHKLCNAGHISYIELDDYPDADTIENIVRYSYENSNISYIGINFHIRYCKDCGTYLHGEDVCLCGSRNIQGISRVTGYLSLDERFGPGKTAERADRVSHDSSHEKIYKN